MTATIKRRAAVALSAVLIALASLAAVNVPVAEAWTSCHGRDHYHVFRGVPTKHDNTGERVTSGVGQHRTTYRVWHVKKDRDGDGNYRYTKTIYAHCGLPT